MPAKTTEVAKRQAAEYNKSVGALVRAAIVSRSLKESGLADDLKISRSMMSLYLAGKRGSGRAHRASPLVRDLYRAGLTLEGACRPREEERLV